MTPQAGVAARILVGTVWHDRRVPTSHRFDYAMWWADLDLDHLDTTVAARRMLSTRRRHPIRFSRPDYLGDPTVPLAESVRDLVHERTGKRPEGPVRLVAHLRTLGWCFNPIALYLCHDQAGALRWVVADVTNTPWKERHQYVLAADESGLHGVIEAKRLHVSPFMAMDQRYRFNLAVNDHRLDLRIDTLTDEGEPFAAGVSLRAMPMTDRGLLRMLVRHPLLTMRVSLGIHTHAVRLWRKRVPIQPHPERSSRPDQVAPR